VTKSTEKTTKNTMGGEMDWRLRGLRRFVIGVLLSKQKNEMIAFKKQYTS